MQALKLLQKAKTTSLSSTPRMSIAMNGRKMFRPQGEMREDEDSDEGDDGTDLERKIKYVYKLHPFFHVVLI